MAKQKISQRTIATKSEVNETTIIPMVTGTADQIMILPELLDLIQLNSLAFGKEMMFISQSQEFTSDMENKFIVCSNNDSTPIILTMPDAQIFSGGTSFIIFITPGGFNLRYNTPIKYVQHKTSAGNDFNSLAELYELFTYNDDEFEISGIAVIGTSAPFYTDENDGKQKSGNLYFKDILDTVAGKIITLGTISFEDINDAPATTDININKAYSLTSGYYVDKLFIIQTEAFDGGLQLQDITDNNSGVSQSIPNGVVEKIFAPLTYDFGNSFDYHASFDNGSSETNPQNLTTGLITIKALIKKLPN